MDRFLIACCLFSFVTGMYAVHMIEAGRGCTVTFVQGKETHVLMGHGDD
ncbi:hypothetical protein UFOVP118_27 [uncultured Caudovirales phage]|uniref:Uncharacterized protein n=1 Tax=uncultured Caudovirales phage TaxID=2100421 RepID=A0A6J5L8N4_9CAUD|nr:hypothetical protein UFOVP118_27 [uncultured Caudovirales phage]